MPRWAFLDESSKILTKELKVPKILLFNSRHLGSNERLVIKSDILEALQCFDETESRSQLEVVFEVRNGDVFFNNFPGHDLDDRIRNLHVTNSHDDSIG